MHSPLSSSLVGAETPLAAEQMATYNVAAVSHSQNVLMPITAAASHANTAVSKGDR